MAAKQPRAGPELRLVTGVLAAAWRPDGKGGIDPRPTQTATATFSRQRGLEASCERVLRRILPPT